MENIFKFKLLKSIYFTDKIKVDGSTNQHFFCNWIWDDKSRILFEFENSQIIELEHNCIEDKEGYCYYYFNIKRQINTSDLSNYYRIEINKPILDMKMYGYKFSDNLERIKSYNTNYSLGYILLNFNTDEFLIINFHYFLHGGEFIFCKNYNKNNFIASFQNNMNQLFEIKL